MSGNNERGQSGTELFSQASHGKKVDNVGIVMASKSLNSNLKLQCVLHLVNDNPWLTQQTSYIRTDFPSFQQHISLLVTMTEGNASLFFYFKCLPVLLAKHSLYRNMAAWEKKKSKQSPRSQWVGLSSEGYTICQSHHLTKLCQAQTSNSCWTSHEKKKKGSVTNASSVS